MTTTTGVESKIDSYLARLRVALHGLPRGEIDDILQELRSHVVELSEKKGQGIEVALESLGDPVELAKTYRAENQMLRAECSGSPLVILQGLRHASRSRLGRVTATALYALGYLNVLTLWAAAIDKLFAPTRAGLWYVPGEIWSLTLVTSGNPPAGARELLGWWLVPIAVLVGWAIRHVTDRIAQWWIGRYRRRKELREA